MSPAEWAMVDDVGACDVDLDAPIPYRCACVDCAWQAAAPSAVVMRVDPPHVDGDAGLVVGLGGGRGRP